MSLGSKLKELRLRRGESLQKVADEAGVSKAHVWELETGKSRNPSLELIKRIADHFKVTVASLIGENLDEDEEIIVMHRDYQGLGEKDRAAVQAMIQHFKQRRKDESGGN